MPYRMHFSSLGVVAVVAPLAVVAWSPCAVSASISPPMSPALKKIIDGAKKEGALTLQYGGAILGGTEGAQVATDGIKKMFGVNLDISYHPGPSFAKMASRLYTEMRANEKGSTDDYNGTAVEIAPYLSRGLWQKIDWTKLYPGRITPTIAEAGGRALRVVTALPGILYNKRVGADFSKVTEMDDLLKPKFKGRIYTEPYLAGFDVLVSDKLWGFDKTAAYVRKLSGQIGGLIRCGSVDQIASGQVPALALDCGGAIQNVAKYRNILAHVIVHDAAMRRFNYLCIPVNAPHPDAAILFGLYVSSPEGQRKIQVALYGTDLDTYPDSVSHPKTAALEKEGVKFTDVTIKWWGDQKNIHRNVRRLIKIITQQR